MLSQTPPTNPTPPPFEAEKMQQLMRELQQIQVTEQISMYPLALGYWLLLLLVCFVLLYFAWRYYDNRYRRIQIAKMQVIYQNRKDDIAYITAMNQILRQVAIYISGRNQVANLTQSNWLHYLQSKCNSDAPKDFDIAVSKSIYDKKFNGNIEAVHQYACNW